jgi:hypothetical protein
MIYATVFIILGAIGGREGAPSPAYRCDPELTRLFTPAMPLMGVYEVCTTDEPIGDRLLEGLQHGDIEALEALDAFSTAGSYRRSALTWLYGGRRVSVARGWSASADRIESITFLSPYPDASLTRLMPGTMAIRFTVVR